MEGQLTCNICSDILYHPVQLHECEHYFCGYCLQEWLRHNPTCPMCRRTPTSAVRSRLLDNLVEIFLHDHQNLIPPAERRAEHASYTPGEGLLSPGLGHSNTYGSRPDIASLQSPRLQSTHTQQSPSTSISAPLDVLSSTPDQSLQEIAERSRASPAGSARSTTTLRLPFLEINNLDEEDVHNGFTQETRRAVTPSATTPDRMEHQDSQRSLVIPTPTYSGQPLSINNVNVHNHYYNQASPPTLPPETRSFIRQTNRNLENIWPDYLSPNSLSVCLDQASSNDTASVARCVEHSQRLRNLQFEMLRLKIDEFSSIMDAVSNVLNTQARGNAIREIK